LHGKNFYLSVKKYLLNVVLVCVNVALRTALIPPQRFDKTALSKYVTTVEPCGPMVNLIVATEIKGIF